MTKYTVQITHEIKIYKEGTPFLYATISGYVSPVYTYYDMMSKMIFQLKKSKYGIRKSIEVLFQDLGNVPVIITKNNFFRSCMLWGTSSLCFNIHFFAKRQATFLLDNKIIGYVDRKYFIENAGSVTYNIVIDSENETINKFFLIFFTGAFILPVL